MERDGFLDVPGSLFYTPRSWEVEFDGKIKILLSPDDTVEKDRNIDPGLPLTDGIPSESWLQKPELQCQPLFGTATLTHENLYPRAAPSLWSVKSESSCATLSTATSRSPRTRTPSNDPTPNRDYPNRDCILGLTDPEYRTRQATSSRTENGNTKRIQKFPASFQCNLCLKRYTRAYNLRSHLKTHTDEKSFVCTVCGKAYAQRHDLKRHEGLHSGEKKFVCKGDLKQSGEWGCGRRFARADTLGRHLRSEAGRICIKSIVDEEVIERQRLWQEQHIQKAGQKMQHPPTGVDPNGSLMDLSGNYTLPAAILAQYPALAMLDWSNLPQADTAMDDDIRGSARSSSFISSISSDSSCDTFSSLSSDDVYIERRNASRGPAPSTDSDLFKIYKYGDDSFHTTNLDAWAAYWAEESTPAITQSTHFSPPSGMQQLTAGYSDVKMSTIIATDMEESLLMKSENGLKNQSAPLDISQVHPCDSSSSNLASSNEEKYMVARGPTQPKKRESGATLRCEADEGRRSSAHLANQCRTREPGQVQSPPMHGLNVRKRLEEVNSVQAVNVNAEIDDDDPGGDAETINAEDDDSICSPSDCISKQLRFSQPSPANSYSAIMGNTLGKASPYSFQTQDGESDSCFEIETELSDDDSDSISSPCPSLLNSGLMAPKQRLIVDILAAFWDIYNKDFSSIVSKCIARMTADVTPGTNSNTVGNSRSASSASAFSTSSTLPSSSTKRKLSEDDFPADGSGQEPAQPNGGIMLMSKKKPAFRYACPFRKHNPRKYNMCHHQRCALGSFGTIARVKEHLYRRHIAPIQCVRCWLFFKDQDKLNIHMLATNICERRDGQLAEGITPSMEKRLRSRKKLSGDQTEADRWRAIYRMLFPEEGVPSPFYETVHDDVAQFSELLDISIEEFMRQEVPEIFTNRLQTEVNNMYLEETGLLDDPARLRQTFITRMTSLINEAQEAAVQVYRQRSSESTSQFNQLMTPGPSSSSGSFPAPWQELGRISHQPEPNSTSALQLAVSSWSQGSQSVNPMLPESDLDTTQSCPTTQMEQATDDLCREASNHLSSLDSSIQHHEFRGSDNCTSRREHNADVEFSSAIQNFLQQNLPSGNDAQLEWEAEYDWATWGDIHGQANPQA